jgi:hypothetical protein
LKILVSVVRFRPGPPKNTKTTFGWFFIWGLAGLDAIGFGYPHQEQSFKRTNKLFIPLSVDVVLNDAH